MMQFIMPNDDGETIAALEYTNIRVEFNNIGEGYNGDFNPNDPDDVYLLRFDISTRKGTGWEPVEDASRCTQIPVGAAPEVILKRALEIHDAVHDALIAGDSIRAICDKCSWMSDANPASAIITQQTQALRRLISSIATSEELEEIEPGLFENSIEAAEEAIEAADAYKE